MKNYFRKNRIAQMSIASITIIFIIAVITVVFIMIGYMIINGKLNWAGNFFENLIRFKWLR